MADLGRADASQQRPDARRQLLGHERFGEVVVRSCLQAGDDVVGVVAGGHHHDRHVAVPTDRAAQLEPVDAGQHDVDQHDVGALALERLDGGFARRHALDGPALVLEGELHRLADPFVVLHGQDSRAHTGTMMPGFSPFVRSPSPRPWSRRAVRRRRRPARAVPRTRRGRRRSARSGRAGPPAKSPERQPASRAISSPAAMSHGFRCRS